MLMLIGATKIDRVVAVLAGIMQSHAAAAATTNSNALQQRVALARHPMAVRIVVIEIVREPPLVRHELLPIDISRKCVLQAKPANPESPRLRSRPAVNRNGGRLACVDGGRKHRPPHRRGSSEPEGCVRCSPAATRCHAAMARPAVVPAPGSWPLENGASPPWRCAARETWRTNGAAARALLHRD